MQNNVTRSCCAMQPHHLPDVALSLLTTFAADGTTTNTTAAADAAACTASTAVPASELPKLQALANTPADSARGVLDPNGPCSQLASALAALGLTANTSTFLSEVNEPLLTSVQC
jgi:hypothetical protein